MLSIILLVFVGAAPRVLQILHPGTVVVVIAVALGITGILGFIVVTGFSPQLRTPELSGECVVLAYRPRRAAVVVSWFALFIGVLSLPLLALSVGDDPDVSPVLPLFGALVGLPVALFLPGLSRRWAMRAGFVELSSRGLSVSAPAGNGELFRFPVPSEAGRYRMWFRGVEGLTTDEELFQITYDGPITQDSSVSRSLPDFASRRLDARVQWIPGALQAVTRWTSEGFAPSPQETLALGLPASWCPGNGAHHLIIARRHRLLLRDAAVVVVLGVLVAGMILLSTI